MRADTLLLDLGPMLTAQLPMELPAFLIFQRSHLKAAVYTLWTEWLPLVARAVTALRPTNAEGQFSGDVSSKTYRTLNFQSSMQVGATLHPPLPTCELQADSLLLAIFTASCALCGFGRLPVVYSGERERRTRASLTRLRW